METVLFQIKKPAVDNFLLGVIISRLERDGLKIQKITFDSTVVLEFTGYNYRIVLCDIAREINLTYSDTEDSYLVQCL